MEVAAELIPPSCADYFVEKVIEHGLTTEGDYHSNFSSLFNSKVKQIRTKIKCLNNPENITSAFENLSKCELLQQLDISAEICLKIPKILQEFVKIFPCVETVKSLKLLACQNILSDSDITLRFLEKLEGANQLRELEIPGAVFDDLAFKELLKLKQLCSLNIDNCKVGIHSFSSIVCSFFCMSVVFASFFKFVSLCICWYMNHDNVLYVFQYQPVSMSIFFSKLS